MAILLQNADRVLLQNSSILLEQSAAGAPAQTVTAQGLAVSVGSGSAMVTGTSPNNAFRISGEQDVPQLAVRSGRFPVTMLGWVYAVSNRSGSYMGIFSLEEGPGHSTSYNELVFEGTALTVYDQNAGLLASFGSVATGTWYKVAFVVENGTYKAYLGTQGTPGVTLGASGSIANLPTSNDYQGIGGTQFTSTEWFDGRISGARVFNAALTEVEIETEFTSNTPVRTTNLLGAWFPPSMTASSTLTAISGADLVDGNGGGIPDYTVEAGPTLDPSSGNQTITAQGMAVAVGTGSATVTPGEVTIGATGLAVSVGTGSATITQVTAINGQGLAVPVATGAASVTPGAVSIGATGLAVAAGTGSATITPGAVSISAQGLAVATALGQATSIPGTVSIAASGLAVPVSSGASTVSRGPVTITATGLAVAASTGSASLTPGPVTISAQGANAAVGAGSATVSLSGGPSLQTVTAQGLSVPVGTGSASLTPGPANVVANGLSVPVGLGQCTIQNLNTVQASGVALGIGFGSATFTQLAGSPQTVTGQGYSVPVAFGPTLMANVVSRPASFRFGRGRPGTVRRTPPRGRGQ